VRRHLWHPRSVLLVSHQRRCNPASCDQLVSPSTATAYRTLLIAARINLRGQQACCPDLALRQALGGTGEVVKIGSLRHHKALRMPFILSV
jgi:hypothetical protein